MQAAAGLLAQAWRAGTRLDALPAECRPRDAAEAYRIQNLFAGQLGETVAGWKIGCTSAVARKLLKTRTPFYGRVFASRLFAGGATLGGAHYKLRGLEGEFAFKLKCDLPPHRRAYGRAKVLDAIASLHPAIEIIDPRFGDWLAVGIPSVIADQGANGALILGTPVRGWRKIDLRTRPVSMAINGVVVGKGTGADCLGDPVAALVWLANKLRRCGGLKAGQVITTGTCCGFHLARAGDHGAADFAKLGRVEVRFAAAS